MEENPWEYYFPIPNEHNKERLLHATKEIRMRSKLNEPNILSVKLTTLFDALGDELLFLIDGFVDNSSYTKFTLYIDKFFKDRTKKINYEVRIEFNYKSTSDLNSYTWVNGKTNDRYDLTKTSKHGNAEYIKMKLTNYLKHRK